MSHLMPLGPDEFHNPDFLNGGKMRLFHSAEQQTVYKLFFVQQCRLMKPRERKKDYQQPCINAGHCLPPTAFLLNLV